MSGEAIEPVSHALHRDRVIMLYEHIREGTISYYIWSIAILSILILSGVSTVGVTLLGIVLVSIQLIKSYYMKKFFSLTRVDNPNDWENYMVIASFLQAFIVSSGVMLLIDLEQSLATYVLITLIAIPAFVSALVLIASVQTHYAWLTGLLFPIAIKSGFSDDPIFWVFGGLILFGGIPSSALVGKKICASFIDTLKLRYENEELVVSLRKEKKRAEKASADKTKFLATASHDLRQPIHALELFSDALEHELDKPVQFELMEKVKESTAAMNGLLYSLLDISRLDANIVQANKSTLLLNDLIEKLVQTIQPLAAQKGVRLVFDAKLCAVVSDAVLLESILHNLLTNAVKYTHDGSIIIRCEVGGKDTVQVIISDTGVGIPEKDQDIIFDDFIQLDNPERDRRKGLGLGLAIVKRTCILLGHQISVQSEQGVGSKFILTLEAANMTDITPQAQTQAKGGALQATVLVIDDERTILEGMEKMLTRWGCEVICAANLSETMEKIKGKANETGQPIDLIIVDYRLAGNQLGIYVIQAVKQYLDAPDLPAMIITGDTGPEQLKDIESVGYHVLHKPVSPMRLRTLMQNILNQD